MPDDINARALRFMCRVLEFVLDVPHVRGAGRVADQLVGAAGGIGSNLEDARAASSRREFLRFNGISLRESRKAIYWLTVCARTGLGRPCACRELLDEAQQIGRIVARIVSLHFEL